MDFSRRFTLTMVATTLVAALLVAFVIQRQVITTLAPFEHARLTSLLERQVTALEQQVADARGDVLTAMRAAPTDALAARAIDGVSPPGPTLEAVERVFAGLLNSHPQYLQLRLIGVAGQGRELVRAERAEAGAAVHLVPQERLQSKGSRPYFRVTVALPPGETYVSRIELNQEHGHVEEPHVPVLRAATPVVGPDGTRLGVVVINVDMRPMLRSLVPGAGDGQTTYVVGDRGDFLVHPDPKQTFGADLEHGLVAGEAFPEWRGGKWAQGVVPALPDRVGAVMTVQPAGGPPLTVLTFVPAASQIATRKASVLAVVAALFAALATGIIALVSGRSLMTQLRTIIEGAPVAMLVVNRERKVLLANQSACALFGYDMDALVGTSIDRLVPAAARDGHGDLLERYFDAPRAMAPMSTRRELSCVHADNTHIPVEILLNTIHVFSEPAVMASVVDMTERDRYEEELRRSNAELEQFAYVASHDLQEPLRMVASYVGILREDYGGKLGADADRYIGYAVDGAKRMQLLIRDLLDYSRVHRSAQPPQAVAAAEVVGDAIHDLQITIEESGAVIHVADLPTVMADRNQLAQVFQNLIANAIKFRGEATPVVHIDCERLEDEHRFCVRDNGIGFEAEHAGRIFEMFQRLHKRGQYAGTGIGLAIVAKIVARHGGRVWAESAPNEGARFFFTLPARAPRGRRVMGEFRSSEPGSPAEDRLDSAGT